MSFSRQIMLSISVLAFIMLAACSTPSAPAADDGKIIVTDAWVRASAAPAPTPTRSVMTRTQATKVDPNGPVSAAYMTLQNTGSKADRLLSVSTAAAAIAEVHETFTQADGMMGMRPVAGGLEVPAGATVSLKPGGYHIMMMNLQSQLVEGQTVKLSLKFASGKQVDVDAVVKSSTGN